MKKRLLLVLVILALLSVVALAACEQHEHKWSPNSDGENHWQECECGEKKDVAPHVLTWVSSDATNHWQKCSGCDYTTTPAAHSDGDDADTLCDACGRDLHSHVYSELKSDANGHWNECSCGDKQTASAHVDVKNNETQAEGADGKCDVCARENYAFELTLGAGDLLKPIQKGARVYYVYTATEQGRYTISLGVSPNSQKCTFITDKTGETVFDKDNGSVNIDLAQNEKVYIILTCAEELDSDAAVGVAIDTCTGGDTLPEGIFPTGEYLDAKGSYNFQFTRDDMQVEFSDNKYLAGYVGGEYDSKLVVVRAMSVATEVWTIVAGENDGEYVMTIESTIDQSKTVNLKFSAPAEPIALSKFSGVYEPKDSENVVDEISQFVIYEDGRGYFVQNDYKSKKEGSYNQMRNKLTLGQYTLTLNLDGETVVSISISSSSIEGSVEYTRKGDSVWIELPVKGKEYVGSTLSFAKNEYDAFGLYQWTESYNDVEITAYDENSKVYTVLDGATVYKFVVEEGQIKVYAEDGTTLVDTLVEFVPVFHDMPASGVEQTLNISDFQKNYYWYKVSKEGWYTIVASGDFTVVRYGLDEDNPVNGGKEVGEKAVLLAVDDIIGVYIGDYYENIPESIALTITEAEAPAGLSEEKPIDLADGSYALEGMDRENVYYFRYVGLKAGSYVIGCTYEDWEGGLKSIHYVINGGEYGCAWDDANWSYAYYGGVTADSPYASIVVAADGDLLIAVDRKTEMDDFADITVTVAADYREGATALTAASGTLAAGKYIIENLSEVESVILGEGDNQVILNKNSLQFGFKVESSVSYVINYVLGSEKNPVKVNANGTTQVLGGQYVTITAPAGQDTLISLGSVMEYKYPVYFSFEYNGKTYGYGHSYDGSYYPLDNVSLSIVGGESVTIRINVNNMYSGEYIPLIVSEDYIKNANNVELIKGEPADDKIVASATISDSGTYNISSIGSAITVTSSAAFTIKPIGGEDIVATEANGVYSAVIPSSIEYFAVALADEQSLTLSVEYVKGSEGYPEDLQLNEGSVAVDLARGETRYVTLPAGTYVYSLGNYYALVSLNGESIEDGVVFTVKDGDVLCLMGNPRAQGTITFSANTAGGKTVYSGSCLVNDYDTDISISANADFSEVDLSIQDDGTYKLTFVSSENNTYTYSYSDFMGENTVTLVVNDDTVICTIPGYIEECSLTKQA